MTKRLPPRLIKGQVNPEWVGSAGLRVVRPWLRSRLEGKDPHLPVDCRVDEDPEAVVVRLLREAGSAHAGFETIGLSARELLDTALSSKDVKYLPRLLRLCQLVVLPHVRSWFAEQLQDLTTQGGVRWEEQYIRDEIVYGALKQRAGSEVHWRRLLRQSRYATWALLALGRTFHERIGFLNDWWTAVEHAEGRREIEQLLFTAFRDQGESEVYRILRGARADLSRNLQQIIDEILGRSDRSRAFALSSSVGSSRMNAIHNACLRPEEYRDGV